MLEGSSVATGQVHLGLYINEFSAYFLLDKSYIMDKIHEWKRA